MKFLTVLLTLICINIYGQNQGNIWYFGDGAGLDFNSGVPVPISGGQTYYCSGHNEGSATIADSSGALLFYTNGREVWNSLHQIMPNGSGLNGSMSATQSSIIIPMPESSRYFYVFTMDGFICGNNLNDGLRYSIVDICDDNGYGAVIAESKNTPLVDNTSEKLTAVKDANGIDYWIITHKFNSDAFYAFKLTSSGISNPVISMCGAFHGGNIFGAIGQLKASPNGQKLAIASGNGNNHMELFDFDNSTGVVSNAIVLPRPHADTRPFGVSFSPDNSKVYFSMATVSPTESRLMQFDLNAGSGNSAAIAASGSSIWHLPNAAINALGLQLGPDGKIYMTRESSVINYPNLIGSACDFQLNAVPTSYGTASYCFPNFVDSYSYNNDGRACLTVVSENSSSNEFNIYPNPAKHTAVFTFENSKNENFTFTLFDTQGRAVRTTIGITGNFVEIKRENLTNGLYFFNLHNYKGDGVTGKLVFE